MGVGITKASVSVFGDSGHSEVELTVDTGSILTWVKSDRLESMGSKPRREKEFKTVEGMVIRRKTGPATVRYDGVEADVEVVFGEESDAEVLGVTALESLGLRIDPVTLKLSQSSLLAL